MYLKKIEIRGFKSFADKIELEINNGITGVVGPNGSGKSNISDAIRWVLGEQSAKTLRGGKMEDVIFSGTTSRKPLGMAEVSLTLDNTSNQLDIAYSEVTIRRRMYRSGESEYSVNKTPCRLKDIRDIFTDTGIGLDGYSMIGQGKIEEILNNRGADRRLLIEEAAGIVKYRIRKEETEKKLENTNQNLIRIEDIIRELSSRLEPLRFQSEKTRKFLELKEKLKYMEINSYIFTIDKLNAEIDSHQQQKNIVTEQIEDHMLEKETMTKTYNKYYSELGETKASIDMLQDNILRASTTIEQKEGEIGICNQKISNASENIKRLHKEILEIKNITKAKADDLVKNKEVLEKQRGLVQIKKNKLQEKLKNLKHLSDELLEREIDLEESKANIIELLNSITQKKGELNNLKNLYDHMVKRTDQLHYEIEKNEQEQEYYKKENQKLQKLYENIQKDVKDIEKQKVEFKQKIKEQIHIENTAREECDKIKQKLKEKQTKKYLLEDMEAQYEGFNKSVKNAIEYAKNDSFLKRQVLGVVAELIDMPKKLDIAIDVALGGSVQNIVCKTAQDANKMIDFLKKNNLGRATFLPLDSIQQKFVVNPAVRKILNNYKGFIGFAAELVEFSKDYEGLFNYLLGKIIIVNKIEDGISIFKEEKFKYKIVSLDGDVINPSGAITGGSYRFKQSNLLGRKREIEELQKNIANLQSEYVQKTKTYSDIKVKLDGFKEKLDFKEKLYNKKEIEMLKLKNQNAQILNELKRYGVIIERNNAELTQLYDEQQDIKGEIQRREKEIEKLSEDERRIRLIIDNGKGSYAIDKETKENLNDEVTQLKIDLVSIEQECIHMEKTIEAAKQYLKELNNSIEDKQNEVEKLKQQNITLNKDKDRLKIELRDTDILKQQYKLNNIQLNNNKENLSEIVLKIKKQIEKKQDMLSELSESRHKIDLKFARLEIQKKSYQNKLWDEYQLTYSQALEYKNQNYDFLDISKDINILKKQITELGNVNLNAIQEYNELMERHQFLSKQQKDLRDGIKALKKVIAETESTMEAKFINSFEKIQKNFDNIFKELFGGGKANLKLEDEEDILSSNIEIIVQPPGKKLQNLSLLSGGEKALTAISLLFAILKVKPTPFCILDEIEAPLDEANAYRYVKFLREFSKETQFIVITHRKATMEAADILYGVTMQEHGVSSLISVNLNEMAG